LGNALCGVVGRVHELARASNEMKRSRVKDVFRLVRSKGDALSALFPENQKDALLQVLQSTETHFDTLSRTLSETVEKLQRGVANCQELLESNRTLVKPQVEMKLKNFSVKNAVMEAVELIPESYAFAGLQLDASLVESHFRMQGERQILLRVVLNLLKNAAEAGKVKGIAPNIKLWTEDFWTHCVLHIADDGKGISSEQMTQVFKRGFTTKEGGSGLGLHGCRKIIRQIGGDLTLFSKGEGEGTEVCLKLPVVTSQTTQKEANYEQMEQ
jgi:signal transduction histidine kinase